MEPKFEIIHQAWDRYDVFVTTAREYRRLLARLKINKSKNFIHMTWMNQSDAVYYESNVVPMINCKFLNKETMKTIPIHQYYQSENLEGQPSELCNAAVGSH